MIYLETVTLMSRLDRYFRALLPLVGLLLAPPNFGQDSNTKIFHVTSVRTEEATDWCTSNECSATRFTVEGYTPTVEYLTECIEIVKNAPPAHYTSTCTRVAAGEEYVVKVLSDAIWVQTEGESSCKPPECHLMLYEIKVQKERKSK